MTVIDEHIKDFSDDWTGPSFYEQLDNQDKFKSFREKFVIPNRRSVSGENPIASKLLLNDMFTEK